MSISAKFLCNETRKCGYNEDGRMSSMDYYGFDHLTPIVFEKKENIHLQRKTRFDLMRKGFLGDIFSAATTNCPSCNACIPLRINTLTFQTSTRQQKKIDAFKQYGGETIWIDDPIGVPKLYQLFNKFLTSRFPNSPMLDYDETTLNAVIRSKANLMVLTNSKNQLLSFAEVDRYEHESSLDFIAYDPDHSYMFLGTVSFLETIRWARDNSIPYVYIGPTNETKSLKYKRYYSGLETYDGKNWIPYDHKIHKEGPDYEQIVQNLG